MKRLFIVALSMFMTCGVLNAETFTDVYVQKDDAREKLNKKASKAARKEAKTLKKAGWVVTPGALPLEKQLDRSYQLQYEQNRDGSPKFLMGSAMSVGETFNAAKMQALELAKQDMVSQVQTQITALIDNSLANKQLSSDDAASISKTVIASKALISNKISGTLTVVECYRDTETKMKEVLVRVAYDSRIAANAAKQAIRDGLDKGGQDLHKELDKLFEEK